MRILYVSLHDPRFAMGGAEKVLLDLATGMRREYGVEVCVAVNEGDLLREISNAGFSTTSLAWDKVGTLKTLSRLKQTIADFKPDIIHSHHRYLSFLTALFFKKKARLIHTEHVLRGDKRWLFRYGHQATAVHETVRAQLIKTYRVPEQKVMTIPNAVRLSRPEASRVESIYGQYACDSSQTKILCVGRFEEQKGHRYLVEAVMRLPETYRRKLRIFLAGEGRLEAEIRSQIRSFQLERCFHFLGHVRHIEDYLEVCDFMILPSLWEGMPLVVLEAQAAGRAVLATDIPGTRETLLNGQTGELVAARDGSAMAKMLMCWMDQPEKIQEMGKAAQKHSEQEFSFSIMLQRYHQLYQSLLKQPR